MATLGDGTALVAYMWCPGDFFCEESFSVRRSIDAGATWSRPVFTTYDGLLGDMTGSGTAVDLVWVSYQDGALRYSLSLDAGASFAEPIELSAGEPIVDSPAVARGPHGVVAVTWGDDPGYAEPPWRVHVRVSTDGGESFAPQTLWATDEGLNVVRVAAGDGVLYVAHLSFDQSLVVQRSLDQGGTWSGTTFPDRAGEPTIVASGASAHVAYATPQEDGQSHIMLRSTSDSGANWSSPIEVAPATWSSDEPALALDGGTLRLIFTRSTTDAGGDFPWRQIFYRESSDGTTWTAPEPVSPMFYHGSEGSDVGFVGRSIVVWDNDDVVFAATR